MGKVTLSDRLVCPGCRSTYLHHGQVEVFDRAEDDLVVRRTRVDSEIAVLTLPNAESGNPSSRRGGLRIQFDCEECDRPSVLCIAQHKGETEVYWADPVNDRAR